jgi:biopolymer transport protein ExbD
MGRPAIAKKQPTVDMTAMCDVAFLLLSFFILATKLKPQESVNITTPNSVSKQVAPSKDLVVISISPAGRVYFSVQDEEKKKAMIEDAAKLASISLSPDEVDKLTKQSMIAVPFAQLKQQAAMNDKEIGEKLPGVDVQDSAHNEMRTWLRAANDAYFGTKMNLLIKGDNVAKYPQFREVIDALKANELFQFQLVTNPEAVPSGSLLWESEKDRTK